LIRTVINGIAAPPPIAHRLEMNMTILSFRVAKRYSLENEAGDGEKARCLSRIEASWAESLLVAPFSKLSSMLASALLISTISSDGNGAD